LCCLLILRPPPAPTLFPYTMLFRSVRNVRGHQVCRRAERDDLPANGREESAKRVTDRGIVLDDEDDRFGRRLRRAVSHGIVGPRSEEHTSELQSRENLVCSLLLEKK